MAMRNSGPSCGEANAPARAVDWMMRPAAGARSVTIPGRGLLLRGLRVLLRRLLGLRRGGRAAEADQLLVFRDLVAVANQHLDDAEAFLLDRDDRFAARHQEARHPHHVGEAGVGRLDHHDDRAGGRAA